jgi:cysteinyl-tRNA synthetase
MEWDSPWGKGAPGWHLECSVMSLKYLGPEPFDIHTGGIDHREIHHPNEIAQNQAFAAAADTGARFWMHNNFLVDRGGKMSKSKGGFTTLQSLIDARRASPRLSPAVPVRALSLGAGVQRRRLAAALTRLKRLVLTVQKIAASARPTATAGAGLSRRLDEAVSDDLNTPQALPRSTSCWPTKSCHPAARMAALDAFDATCSGSTCSPFRATSFAAARLPRFSRPKQIERPTRRAPASARRPKDFAQSDAIRDELPPPGVEVMDGDPLRWDWKPTL